MTSLYDGYMSKRCYIVDNTHIIILPPYSATITNAELWEVAIWFTETDDPGFLYPVEN